MAISVENHKIFPPSCILHLRWRGSPWNWASVLAVKKLEWCGYRADDIFSRLDRMHERYRQTDRQRDTGPLQRLRLHIALCGNNIMQCI